MVLLVYMNLKVSKRNVYSQYFSTNVFSMLFYGHKYKTNCFKTRKKKLIKFLLIYYNYIVTKTNKLLFSSENVRSQIKVILFFYITRVYIRQMFPTVLP